MISKFCTIKVHLEMILDLPCGLGIQAAVWLFPRRNPHLGLQLLFSGSLFSAHTVLYISQVQTYTSSQVDVFQVN